MGGHSKVTTATFAFTMGRRTGEAIPLYYTYCGGGARAGRCAREGVPPLVVVPCGGGVAVRPAVEACAVGKKVGVVRGASCVVRGAWCVARGES